MNTTIKTVLLTVLTLSVFAMALVELSGVSRTALFNKFNGEEEHSHGLSPADQAKRDEEVKNMPKTHIEVLETKFDFGDMKEGDKVRHTWIVKNAGEHPLIISNVQTSCGCTVPSFSKEPVAPGKQGEITLEFNSAGKPGDVNKNALIIANADNAPFSIGFSARVEKKS
jgi:hypothetical protein